jgi:hypothetical protein
MNIRSLRVVGVAAAAVAAVGISSAFVAQAIGQQTTGAMVPAPPTATTQVVSANATVPLTSDVSAEVDVWLSEPLLSLDGSRKVRVVSVTADFNCKRLSINKAHTFGTFDAQSSEAIRAESGSVSIGIAKMMAKQILGGGAAEAEAEFVPERVSPSDVVVRPIEGKSWGSVLAETDIEIATAKAK